MSAFSISRIHLLQTGMVLGSPFGLFHVANGGEVMGQLPFTPYQTVLIGTSGESRQQVLRHSDTAVETWRFTIPEAVGSGGATVATGDFDGDGKVDIVMGAGPGGGPHIRVFSGADGSLQSSFFAFDRGFRGGVYVAVGDVSGDQSPDIIVGAGAGGGPQVKVFDGKDGSEIRSFFAYSPSFTGGVRVAAGDVDGDGTADIITGAGPGGGPHVRVFAGTSGSEIRSFFAFSPSFNSGVFVGSGQIDGETGDDIVVGGSEGFGPYVRVFDGRSSSHLFALTPFLGTANGGARVSVGDIDGDGMPEILASPDDNRNIVRVFDRSGTPSFGFTPDIATRQGGIFVAAGNSPQNNPVITVGNGPGSPPGATVFEITPLQTPIIPDFSGTPQGITVAMSDHTGDGIPDMILGSGGGVESWVSVFDGTNGGLFGGFQPYDPTFTGGITVCGADFEGDGHSEIITGPGPGTPQEVRVFDGNNIQIVHSFFAYESQFRGGVRVATGDVNGDGIPDIVTGAGPSDSGPLVKVFDGLSSTELHSFFAYEQSLTNGVFVAAGDINGDGKADIITGPGSGMGPSVKVFDGNTGVELTSFFAFDQNFTGGVHVAAGDVTGDGVDDIVVSPSVGGLGEFRVFGNGGADLIAVVPGFAVEGFPIAVADRPSPDVRITSFRVSGSGASEVELQCTRGLFLHLESCRDLNGWQAVTSVRSNGISNSLEDTGSIGEKTWFVRGRAR